MNYGSRRVDIQVLRALAVLLVIIFHLDEAWLPNGYLGVDIFFVISGYVITRSIWYRHLNGVPFSAHTFFARRIARLLPALLFTVLIAFVLGFLLYSPADYKDLATSAIYAIGGLSNIYFFTQTDYFSAPLQTMPLLHTWSLSVEEQFYILFAVISSVLTLLSASFIRWSIVIWAIFLFVSLYFVFSGLDWVKDSALIRQLALEDALSAFKFYLLPSRIYQLALGVLAACLIARFGVLPISYMVRQVVWWAGVAGIIIAVLFIGRWFSADVRALIVCLLVLLTLVFGEGEKDIVQHGMFRPLVLIGNRSYSLYLVHWPMAVFITYYMAGANQLYSVALSIIAIVLLGEISFRVFERRKWFSSDHTTGVSAIFVYILLLIISLLFLVVHKDGLKFRIENKGVDKFYQYHGGNADTKSNGLPEIVGNGAWVGYMRHSPKNAATSQRILVMGDSHADHLSELARYYAATRKHSWTLYSFPGCPPLFGYYKLYTVSQKNVTDKQKACRRQTGLWKDYITQYASQYDVVVLSARWNFMFEHAAFNGKTVRKGKDYLVKMGGKETATLKQSRSNFIAGLKDTVNYLQSLGLQVVVLGQPPLSTIRLNTCSNVPKYIFDDERMNRRCNPDPYADIIKRGEFVDTVLRDPQAFGMRDLDTLVATDVFCDHQKKMCNRVYYGKAMFNDDNHYNRYGAIYLAKTWQNSESFPFK